jgi:hypothetical protein
MSEHPLNREERYQAALQTHAHFDNLSVAIVSGMVAVTGAAFAIKPSSSIPSGGALVLLISSVVVLVLLKLYINCARSALIARNLSAELEIRDLPYGISHVSININEPDFEKFKPVKGQGLGEGTRTVSRFAYLLTSTLILGACFELFADV